MQPPLKCKNPRADITIGLNNMFADNGLSDVQSFLYFPADAAQMTAIVKTVFFNRGLRFVFSTRSKVPWILKEDGTRFFEGDYRFVPGKDDVIVEGKAGYVVSFGEMLYRSWDAVLRCRERGLDVGLINKACLNVVDEQVWVLRPGCTRNAHRLPVLEYHEDRAQSLRPHRRVFQSEDWG